MKRNPVFKLIAAIIIIALLIPAFFIARSFGVFQKEVVLTKYKLVIESNGKLYDAFPLMGSFAAVDKKGENKNFYYQIERSGLQELFQLAYGRYEIDPSTDNPFLAGAVRYEMQEFEFVNSEKEYTNANDYEETYVFYNELKEPVYRYNPEKKADKDYVKSIITAGMTRNRGGEVIDPYLNITRLFKDKLGIEVKITVDKEKKLAVLSMVSSK